MKPGCLTAEMIQDAGPDRGLTGSWRWHGEGMLLALKARIIPDRVLVASKNFSDMKNAAQVCFFNIVKLSIIR
jgi:hypothetical protein